MNNVDIDNFARAFASGHGSIRMQCDCGTIYYVDDERESWDCLEFESLRKMNNSKPLDYCPSEIAFGGSCYVADCNCWHEKAERVRNWLLIHKRQVAKFFQSEKEELLKQAESMPDLTSIV